ncbi:MAG: zinc ribbon domain-containing protein [Ruminococcus sp.]
MPKFCGNCGAKMDDDARICGNCGTPYAGNSDDKPVKPVKISGVNSMSEEKKKKIKLIAKLATAAIVVIIVAVIAVNIISSFTGYKGAINKAMNAFENYDIETLMSMTSDIGFGNLDATTMENSISNAVSSQLDAYENVVGHDMSISYEIEDSYKLSERKYQEFLKYAENSYNYDTSDISEIVLAKLKINTKGSLGETSYTVNDLYLIKERDKWYLFRGYIGTNY